MSSPSCASPISAKTTLNSFLSSAAPSWPAGDTTSSILAWMSLDIPLSPRSCRTPWLLMPLPSRLPASRRASKASMYESGTSDAGRSDLTNEALPAFLGVGNAHGESLLSRSSANKLFPVLPAGLGSSSNSDDDCFARAGRSSSPKRDMAAVQSRWNNTKKGPQRHYLKSGQLRQHGSH